jgi:tRNA nucleotidyltransferase (CCA-adding enzyme)
LDQYDLFTQILLATQATPAQQTWIWRYLDQWSQVKPVLTGNDLKAIGYPPGPKFKQILQDLRLATLEGVVSDRTQAEAWLARHYPIASL